MRLLPVALLFAPIHLHRRAVDRYSVAGRIASTRRFQVRTLAQYLVLGALFIVPASAQGIGVRWTGEVVLLDPSSGFAGVAGHAGFKDVNAMARTADGRVLVASNEGATRLIEIDLVTFNGSKVHMPGLHDIRGLAAVPNAPDLLYAVDAIGSQNYLYRLDISGSGGKTLIGKLPFQGIQALAFTDQGRLFGWDVSVGLLRIDPATADAVDVNGAPDGTSDLQTLTFHDGSLYGLREELVRFSLPSGDYTQVSAGPFGDVRGAELFEDLCGSYSYCRTSPNSVGPGAILSVSGIPSIGSGTFALAVSGGPPGQAGLFFYGPEPDDRPLANGVLCIGSGTQGLFRLPVFVFDGIGEAQLTLDFTVPPLGGGGGAVVPGVTVHFQAWYRDPGVGLGSNLSDAVGVLFCE